MISPINSIYVLALNSGVYAGFSKFALSMWLRDVGADLMLLNLFSLTMFPSVFGAFWLPFLENYDALPFKFGIKKNLIIVSDVILILMTTSLPFFNVKELTYFSKSLLILFLVLYASIISTRDSISIGYKMEFISKEKLSEYDGFISSFYQTGVMISTTGLLFLSEYFSWSRLFCLMSIWFVLNLIIACFVANSSYNKKESVSFVSKFSKPYKDFLKANKGLIWALIPFLILYNLADRMLAGNLNYYILDQGISKSAMATLRTAQGFLAVFLGVLSSYIAKKVEIKKTLIAYLCLYSTIPVLITLNIYFGVFGRYEVQGIMLVYVFEKLFKTLQGTAFFSYQMQFCTKEGAGSQRALFTLFEKGFSMASAPVIGLILKMYGYNLFFLLVSLIIFLSLPSAVALFKAQEQQKKKLSKE